MQQPLVLIIDRCQATRAMYADYLRHNGYAVVDAADFQRGLQLFEECQPAVVVTELHGPDAPDAVRRMRAASGDDGSCVIACSTLIDGRWPWASGFDLDVALPKPTSPKRLLREIEWVLASEQRGAVA